MTRTELEGGGAQMQWTRAILLKEVISLGTGNWQSSSIKERCSRVVELTGCEGFKDVGNEVLAEEM